MNKLIIYNSLLFDQTLPSNMNILSLKLSC